MNYYILGLTAIIIVTILVAKCIEYGNGDDD